MGRNKELRKKIAGCQRVIDSHEEKIHTESLTPQPDVEMIGGWRREIEVQKAKITRLIRRLKRDW